MESGGSLQIAITPMPQRNRAGGSQSAPPKTGTKMMYDAQKGYQKLNPEKVNEKAYEDQKQGKSKGKDCVAMEEEEEFDEDEDDMLSEEFGINIGQEEEVSSSQHTVGLVQCPHIEMHKDTAGGVVELLDNSSELKKNSELMESSVQDDLPARVNEDQRIKPTRQSSRIQDQMMDKLQGQQEAASKKRNYEGLGSDGMKEVLEAGANSMMKAAIRVMQRQGRCVVLRGIRGPQQADEDEEVAVAPHLGNRQN